LAFEGEGEFGVGLGGDLGGGDFAGHGGEGVEVAGVFVEDEVAVPVALRGADEGVVGADAVFEDVVGAVEGADFFGW
jgi:hypothetical protein